MIQAFGTYKDKIETVLTKEFNNYISKFDFNNKKNFNSVSYVKLNNKTLSLNFMFNLDTNVNSLLVNKFITNYINKENNIFKEILDYDISNSEVNVSKIGASEKVIVKGIINKILEGADVRNTLGGSCAVVEGRSNIKASDICNLLDASDSEYSVVFEDEESIIDGFKAVAPDMMKELEDAGYDVNYFEFRDWLSDFDRDDIELEDIGYNVVNIYDDTLNKKFYAWAYKRPVLKLIADYGEYHAYGGVLVVV